jgi:putative SOS response-associated peptidase YedK
VCGRFVAKNNRALIEEYFSLTQPIEPPFLTPDFNVAPSRDVYVVTGGAERKVQVMRWGLVPSWAKDATIGNRLINARLETVAEKPSFRSSFKKRRCLVAADGFYEWQQRPNAPKQPFYLHPAEQPLLAIAGIFELPHDPSEDGSLTAGEPFTFSILTTEATSNITVIHHRMPVVVPSANWQAWLDPDLQDAEELLALVPAAADDLIEAYPVAREVNNVRDNSATLLERVEETG